MLKCCLYYIKSVDAIHKCTAMHFCDFINIFIERVIIRVNNQRIEKLTILQIANTLNIFMTESRTN